MESGGSIDNEERRHEAQPGLHMLYIKKIEAYSVGVLLFIRGDERNR